MDTDNSVDTVGMGGIKGINGDGNNTIKKEYNIINRVKKALHPRQTQ